MRLIVRVKGFIFLGLVMLAPPCTSLASAWEEVGKTFIEQHHERLDSLFAALGGNEPAVSEAKALWQKNAYRDACEALLAYYRNRPTLPDEVLFGWNARANPLHNPNNVRDLAPEVVALRFTIQGVTAQQHLRADGNIDWNWRGPRDDPEWAWLLNRHAFFFVLAKEWESDPRPEYPELVSQWVSDWIAVHPAPTRLSFSSAWRALEAARRMTDAWPQVFEVWRSTPAFTAEARMLMLSSVPEHAVVLRDHGSFWGGNHLVTEKTALAKLALVWPEFREAPEWFDYAASRISEELLAQTYPDGAYKELTNHYQKVILLNAQTFLVLLEYSGRADAYLEVRERILEMWRYFAGVALPSGYGPLNNAADREHNMGLLATDDGITPLVSGITQAELLEVYNDPPRTRLFPWAGQAIMRSRTGRDGLWAFFEMGPYGTAHQHEDRLHLSVSVRGIEVLTDGGRYTYQPGKWRDYFKGSRSHNVVLLDGEPSEQGPLEAREAPLPIHKQKGDNWDYFSATADFPSSASKGRGKAQWRRGVLHLHDYGWIVIDDITAYGPREVETLWHFAPDAQVVRTQDGLQALDDRDLPLLTIKVLGDAKPDFTLLRGQESPQVAGWHAPQYNTRLPAWELTATYRTQRPLRIIWELRAAQATGTLRYEGGTLYWEQDGVDTTQFSPEAIGSPNLDVSTKN